MLNFVLFCTVDEFPDHRQIFLHKFPNHQLDKEETREKRQTSIYKLVFDPMVLDF
jgi:hypothetical protein